MWNVVIGFDVVDYYCVIKFLGDNLIRVEGENVFLIRNYYLLSWVVLVVMSECF